MAKVSSFHTNSVEEPPEHRKVHHDRDDCLDGKRIKTWHREPGTGNKSRCKVCISVD